MARSALNTVLGLAAIVMLGCAPVKGPHSASSDADAPQGDPFARSLAQLTPGVVTNLPTPYGPDSRVKAGSDYASGLGIPCRRVDIVANGMGHRIAVCNGTQGWYVSDPVFDTAF